MTDTDDRRCNAAIRPMPDKTIELRCEEPSNHKPVPHRAVLRDYAYPGSETAVTWADHDRRSYRGDWPGPCGSDCTLPSGHHGRHAP